MNNDELRRLEEDELGFTTTEATGTSVKSRHLTIEDLEAAYKELEHLAIGVAHHAECGTTAIGLLKRWFPVYTETRQGLEIPASVGDCFGKIQGLPFQLNEQLPGPLIKLVDVKGTLVAAFIATEKGPIPIPLEPCL